jgi:hypothetical protein
MDRKALIERLQLELGDCILKSLHQQSLGDIQNHLCRTDSAVFCRHDARVTASAPVILHLGRGSVRKKS